MAHVCYSLDRRRILPCQRAVLGRAARQALAARTESGAFCFAASRSSKETNGYDCDDLVCICALRDHCIELYRTAPHPQESGILGAKGKIDSTSVIRHFI